MQEGTKKPIKILIAEDEPRIRNLLAGKIEKLVENCQIVGLAADGREALQKVEECRPDIVFTDIKMPVMDGLELSRLIKAQYSSIYVVVVSGYSDFSFAQQAIRYGVFNYLLKPLENDKLLETVEEIRKKLEESSAFVPSGLVSRSIQSSVQSVDGMAHGHNCYLLTVCFFNLCYDNKDEVLFDIYADRLSGVSWEDLFNDTPMRHCDWVVADEYAANQKSILVLVPEGRIFTAEEAARCLQEKIHRSYPGLRVNLCCHETSISRKEVWIYTKRMRHILESQVTPAEPRIFVLERDELHPEDESFETVRLWVQNNVKSLLKAGDYTSLRKELKSIFQFVLENHASQKQVSRSVQHIYKLLEYFLERYDAAKVEEKQKEFWRSLSRSSEPETIAGAFSKSIDSYFSGDEEERDNQKLREEILRYVDGHYTTIDGVEQVADIFKYNYTYLSRMFKNMTGVSMIKYITAKRIEAAKGIMKEKPELGINVVCEMVGYSDQHYFSRAFKAATGISPSEYKASHRS